MLPYIQSDVLSGAIRAWVPMLKDAIAATLNLLESDEKNKVFFREVSEEKFGIIRNKVRRLASHPIWSDPSSEIDDRSKVNQPSITKKFLKGKGLDVAWILGIES